MVSLINLPSYQPSPLLDLSPISRALEFLQRQALEQQRLQLAQNADMRAAELQPEHIAQMRAGTRAQDAATAHSQGQEARAMELQPEQIAQIRAGIAAQGAQTAHAVGQERRATEMQPLEVEARRKAIDAAKYIPVKDGTSLAVQDPTAPGGLRYIEQPDGGVQGTRERKLREVGIDPNSAEGQNYILNGKMSEGALKIIQKKQIRDTQALKITEGLNNMSTLPDRYGASFESATGPFAGAEPGSMLSAPAAYVARGVGEVSNKLAGGKFSPSEVRSNIQGGTLALSQAIKPLIREPGEGAWTDADQEHLNRIVGDLPQARSVDEYRRRLNDVRDRVKANFGLDIKFDAMPKLRDASGTAKPAPAQAAAPAAAPAQALPKRGDIVPHSDGTNWRFLGGNPADQKNWRPMQ